MFTFAWPMIFTLIPVLWLMDRYFNAKPSADSQLRVPMMARVQNLHSVTTRGHNASNWTDTLLRWSIWLCLLFACANPQWLGDPLPIKQTGRNIMLAIDLSRSMEINDLQRQGSQINRLDVVKEVSAKFIEKRHGDKLGLILFGSKAFLQTPLTFDHQTVLHMLNDASIGLAGDTTAIGEAIGMAVKKMQTTDAASRILILLTDGQNNSGVLDPIEATDLAKRYHIKIYTIGIGAKSVLVNVFFGSRTVNPSSDLDEKLLQKISVETQGQYFRAEDDKTLNAILEAINRLEPVNADEQIARPITALFYWPLAMGLALLGLLIFPKHAIRWIDR
jgi:Ca-activated chloride channel family protein